MTTCSSTKNRKKRQTDDQTHNQANGVVRRERDDCDVNNGVLSIAMISWAVQLLREIQVCIEDFIA